jgi:hypothetical protein
MRRGILVLIMTIALLGELYAQKQFTVTILKTSTPVELTDDAGLQQTIPFQIRKNYPKKAAFTISAVRPEEDADVVRSFLITDVAGNEIARLEAQKKLKGTYEIPLQTLARLLTKGRTYTITTLGIPADPAIAARVRVRPMPFCLLYAE